MAEEYVNKESLAKHIDSRFGEISTPFVVREIRDFPAADVAPKSEVAAKIFAEIEKKECHNIFGETTMYMLSAEEFAELKKKYTEEK